MALGDRPAALPLPIVWFCPAKKGMMVMSTLNGQRGGAMFSDGIQHPIPVDGIECVLEV